MRGSHSPPPPILTFLLEVGLQGGDGVIRLDGDRGWGAQTKDRSWESRSLVG